MVYNAFGADVSSSSRTSYPSLPRERESSLIPSLLLSASVLARLACSVASALTTPRRRYHTAAGSLRSLCCLVAAVPRRVVASSISFAFAQARKLIHSAAPPFRSGPRFATTPLRLPFARRAMESACALHYSLAGSLRSRSL